jgi:hypothetical protein
MLPRADLGRAGQEGVDEPLRGDRCVLPVVHIHSDLGGVGNLGVSMLYAARMSTAMYAAKTPKSTAPSDRLTRFPVHMSGRRRAEAGHSIREVGP